MNYPGDSAGYSCAMLGSTVDTCSASVRYASGRNSHIFFGEVTSPESDACARGGDTKRRVSQLPSLRPVTTALVLEW